MTSTLVLLAVVLVAVSEARLLAWEGFHASHSTSNLREIDVATGRVGSTVLGTTTTYSGEASCAEQSSGTFTCVGSNWEYGAGNLTIVAADGRVGLFPLPIELRDGHWLSGIGVTTFGDNKYLVGLDDFLNTIVYSISPAHSYSRLSKGAFQSKNYGLVDTLVATPTKVWIGLGNTSISHWDRKDYQFAGIDITGKAFNPIITPLSKDISTARCYYSQKEQSPVCLTKRDQVNSPTQLIRLDDATGDIKVLCPKVDGIADNMYLHTSAFDSAAEVFYIVGRAQHEHSSLMRFRGNSKQSEGFRARVGAGPDSFFTFKLGQCAAQSVPLSGIDPPNMGISVWQLMVI